MDEKECAQAGCGFGELGHGCAIARSRGCCTRKGYSLQANKKTREGAQIIPTATLSLQHINETVTAALAAGEPVISVDAKKRELIGDFKAVGREFQPKGSRSRSRA